MKILKYFTMIVLMITLISCSNNNNGSLKEFGALGFLEKDLKMHPYIGSDKTQDSSLQSLSGSNGLFTLSEETVGFPVQPVEPLTPVQPLTPEKTSTRNILLLSDADTKGTYALAAALSSAGFTVTHRPAPEFTYDGLNPALSDHNCVVHLDGQTYQKPLPLKTQGAMSRFVADGGGYIGAQWNSDEFQTGKANDMADLILQEQGTPNPKESFNCANCDVTYVAVSGQAKHPVMKDMPAQFVFRANGHDAGAQIIFADTPSTVLFREKTGSGPAVLVRDFGKGKVVNFSFAPNYSSKIGETLMNINVQKLYINAAEWTCNAAPSSIEVSIDIKPGSDENPINLRSRGVIPVAILGTASFNVADIDESSLKFGPNGASPFKTSHIEDINMDGFLDLNARFKTEDVGFSDTDTEGKLEGQTIEGIAIFGTDQIRIVSNENGQNRGHSQRGNGHRGSHHGHSGSHHSGGNPK